MYGIHCDMCGRFSQTDNVDGWAKIAVLTTVYGGIEEEKPRHVCPTCLAILTDKFLD